MVADDSSIFRIFYDDLWAHDGGDRYDDEVSWHIHPYQSIGRPACPHHHEHIFPSHYGCDDGDWAVYVCTSISVEIYPPGTVCAKTIIRTARYANTNPVGQIIAMGTVRTKFFALSLLSAFLCLLLFTGFSWYVKKGGFKGADLAATVKLQEKIDTSSRLRLAAVVGDVMEGSTFFASPGFASVVVVLLTGVALYDWKQKKVRPLALVIPLFFTLLVLAEIYGKTVVHHPAPPFYMIKNPTSIFPKDYINEEFSYPSGHTARAVFVGIVFYSLSVNRKSYLERWKKNSIIAVGVCGYIFLVAVSRIYLGHHWLSDILGGGFLGASMALFSLTATQKASYSG